MKKLITLATTAAIAINTVSPAFATSLPSWEDVIANHNARVAANKFSGYTLGKHSNAVFKPLAGRDGYLFGNVIADDIPLPRVTDVTKVLNAAKQGEKPIIVASQEWLLPSNPMLCEIARQVKMDCAEFTRLFYMHMQKNDDGTYVGDDKAYEGLYEIQAELVAKLEAMELVDTSEDPAVTQLKATLKSLELADSKTHAATIELLKGTIADMESAFKWDLEAINAKLSDLDTLHKELQDKHDAEVKAHNAEIKAHKQTIQDHIDELAGYRNSLKDAGVKYDESLQTMINALVSMRNNLQNDFDVYTKGYEDFATAADVWQKSQEEATKSIALGLAGTEGITATTVTDEAGDTSLVWWITDGYVLVKDTTIMNDQPALVTSIEGIDYAVEGNNVTLSVKDGYTLMTTAAYEQKITDEKEISYQKGINSIDLEGEKSKSYNKGFDAGVASVVITDFVEELATAKSDSYDKGFAAGVASIDLEGEKDASYTKGFQAGVASIDLESEKDASYTKGFKAGVASVVITDFEEELSAEKSASYDKGFAAGAASITIADFADEIDIEKGKSYDKGFDAGVASIDLEGEKSKSYIKGQNSVGLAENPNWFGSAIDGDYNIGQHWQYKKSGKMDVYLSNGKTVEINVARFAEYVKENLGKDVNVTGTSYDDFTQKITVNVSDGGNFTDSYEIDVSEVYQAGVDSVSFSFTINSTKYTVDENSDILTVFNAAKDVSLSQAIAKLPAGQGYSENQAGIVAALVDFGKILDNVKPTDVAVSGNVAADTTASVALYGEGFGIDIGSTEYIGSEAWASGEITVADLMNKWVSFKVSEVASAIETAYDDGYDEGYEDGYKQGYSDGWDAALSTK